MEAQIAHVNACRDEDVNMFQQADQEDKNRIQALEDVIVKWQEYYSEKASMKHELTRVLTAYKTGCKNAAELKETIVRMINHYLWHCNLKSWNQHEKQLFSWQVLRIKEQQK